MPSKKKQKTKKQKQNKQTKKKLKMHPICCNIRAKLPGNIQRPTKNNKNLTFYKQNKNKNIYPVYVSRNNSNHEK